MARLCPSPEAKERFRDIYECLMEGQSYSQIGQKYKISKQRVHQIVRHFSTAKQYAEIRKRIEQRSLSTFLGTEVMLQLDAGHTCYAISKNLGCSVSFVKRISSKRNKKTERMS